MGQKLSEDIIGSLSHNAGVVSLAASKLTIGGQQYSTSLLQHTLGTMTANTLYMLYAVISGGVVSLVKDTAVNSIGPTGYTIWKLVGALYANGLAVPVFGSFVNIEGVPTSNTIDFLMTIGATTTPPTKATTTILDKATWRQIGDSGEFSYQYRHTNNAGATAGTGTYLWGLPTNLLADTSKITPITSMTAMATEQSQSIVGPASVNDEAGNGRLGAMLLRSTSSMTMQIRTTASPGDFIVDSTAFALNTSVINYSFRDAKIPISGFSNTPLKDL